MNAQDILKLLERKHARDVFIPECKSGASAHGYLRVDAWALNKSYTNPRARGYEIKTSRSDFLRDDKWHAYLDYCHEFYFVCPAGLIAVEELGEHAGLICVSKTGTRLYTKRKAPHRAITIPERFYWYILFSRARITRPYFYEHDQPGPDYWRRWLEDEAEQQNTGHRVSREIARRVSERVGDIERENHRLQADINRLQEVKEILEEMGFDRSWFGPWDVRRKVEELRGGLPKEVDMACAKGIAALTELQRLIQEQRREDAA